MYDMKNIDYQNRLNKIYYGRISLVYSRYIQIKTQLHWLFYKIILI